MLARPDPSVLWSFYGFAFELWLPTDVARAVERAPETWHLRRSRRTALSFHMELESSASMLWLATASNELVGVEWRTRSGVGDASLAAVERTLEDLDSLLLNIEHAYDDLGESLAPWQRAREKPRSAEGYELYSLLDRLGHGAEDAKDMRGLLRRVHRLPVFADVPRDDIPRAPRVGARDALPAELLAIAADEREHYRAYLASSSPARDVAKDPNARVTGWLRTPYVRECTNTASDGSYVRVYVPRSDAPAATADTRGQKELDAIASLWRGVAFAATERTTALDAIPEADRAHWQKRACQELYYVAEYAAVYAYGKCDGVRVDLGATLPDDPSLRLPDPPRSF